MNDEFKQAFSELSVDNKRNELNNEMEVAFRMLKVIKKTLGCDIRDEHIANYDIVNDANLDEGQMLDWLYADFYIIQKNIIDIADAIIQKNYNE